MNNIKLTGTIVDSQEITTFEVIISLTAILVIQRDILTDGFSLFRMHGVDYNITAIQAL